MYEVKNWCIKNLFSNIWMNYVKNYLIDFVIELISIILWYYSILLYVYLFCWVKKVRVNKVHKEEYY